MVKEKVLYKKRAFLNSDSYGGSAHVIAEVTYDDCCGVSANLHIADCTRAIDLSFPTHDAKARANSLRKVGMLIEVLTKFEEAILEGVPYAEEAERKSKEERKKRRKAKASSGPTR